MRCGGVMRHREILVENGLDWVSKVFLLILTCCHTFLNDLELFANDFELFLNSFDWFLKSYRMIFIFGWVFK